MSRTPIDDQLQDLLSLKEGVKEDE